MLKEKKSDSQAGFAEGIAIRKTTPRPPPNKCCCSEIGPCRRTTALWFNAKRSDSGMLDARSLWGEGSWVGRGQPGSAWVGGHSLLRQARQGRAQWVAPQQLSYVLGVRSRQPVEGVCVCHGGFVPKGDSCGHAQQQGHAVWHPCRGCAPSPC